MALPKKRVLLGNEAIARGIVEAGCHFMASYPGTPSSEILPGVVRFKEEEGLDTYIEWSTNEKVAFENALAAAYTGKRAAVCMKQVGLNVATDPLMSSAYIGVAGGFVIISCDDPGPHSSQTEQDSRFHGMFAKIPVLDPSSPQEAKEMVAHAFELSEHYQIPVILRPTLRICHARQSISFGPIRGIDRKADFEKNPERWSATPRFRFFLHKELNKKLENIREEFNQREDLNRLQNPKDESTLGIIAAGVSHAILQDVLTQREMEGSIPLLKISTPYPLPTRVIDRFMAQCDHILLLEEPEPVIELQIEDKSKIFGRLNGTVPGEGELLPQTIARILGDLCHRLSIPWEETPESAELEKLVLGLDLPVRRPSLCSGCPHRAAFYAMKRSFPNAIFPSDIGCYTLGMNLKAVDTCHDMGASITFASGFYQAYHQDGRDIPIIATIGDSTFYHSGPPGLLNAVYNGSRFVLVILDNEITAMTGMQPTPEGGVTANGHPGRALSLEGLVKGCGVKYLKVIINPYDIKGFMKELRHAVKYTRDPDGGVAVIISRHPCITHKREQPLISPVKVDIRHIPPPEKDLPAIEKGAIPEELLPRYEEKTAPCQASCPIQVDARGYITLISEGKFDEALALVREKNPFPGITGRICSRPCEKVCRRGDVDQPVAINLLKRFLADHGNQLKMDIAPGQEKGERVAIVGSGPTGLMAAYELRKRGYPVTIFEALPVAGGTLAVATPRFRLPQEVLEKEIDIVRQMGAELRTNTPVGPGLSLDDLRNQGYRAVLLAVGATRGRQLTIPGHDAHGVMDALDFLKAIALHGEVDVGAKVVIVGGGNRAVDAARTALRLGADEVTILYNRTSKEIPADADEIREGEAEGVRIRYLSTLTKVLVRDGRVSGIEVATTTLSQADSLGRRRVISMEGPQETLDADTIIVALGSTPDLSFLENGLATTRWGTIEVDPVILTTSMDEIFAAGDVVTGPKTFIEALAAGRKAAISIDGFLRGEDLRSARGLEKREAQFALVDIEKVEPQSRVQIPTLSPQHRKENFREVHLLPEREKIVQEAERCLNCGQCTRCDTCLIHCPEGAVSKNDDGYVIDYSKCTGCRVCAVECPTSTITMPVVGSCVACEYCLKFFECPSLLKGQDGKVVVDRRTCIDCGLCLEVCSQNAIIRME